MLDGLDTEVKAVYLDRGFHDSKVSHVTLGAQLRLRGPDPQWGEAIQREHLEGWSRIINHDLTGKLDGHSWTVKFSIYIDCTYLNR
jgi:hypothetical protein